MDDAKFVQNASFPPASLSTEEDDLKSSFSDEPTPRGRSGSINIGREIRSLIPYSVMTVPLESVALPTWIERKMQERSRSYYEAAAMDGNHEESLLSPRPQPLKPALAFLQQLAVINITKDKDTLHSFIASALNLSKRVDLEPPLNLRVRDGLTALHALLASTLHIAPQATLVQQVLDIHNIPSSKDVEADALSLIIDKSHHHLRMAGAVKVFSNAAKFEGELTSLSRFYSWLEGSKFIDLPVVLAARFTLVPNDGLGGVLIFSSGRGVPFDDLIHRLGQSARGSAERKMAFDQLMDVVVVLGKAFAEFHTIPPKSGAKVKKIYLKRHVTKVGW